MKVLVPVFYPLPFPPPQKKEKIWFQGRPNTEECKLKISGQVGS
jgi:hypothetical protein